MDGIFDPANVAQLLVANSSSTAPPAPTPPKPAPAKPTSLSLMPAPFDWVEIPGGRGTMKTNESGVTLTIPTEKYWMSKYPITNAQLAKFIEAGGYKQQKW